MKILMVNVYGHVTGGADSHCLSLAKALEDRGHDVAFLATESPLNVVQRGQFVPLTVTHETRDALAAPGEPRSLGRPFGTLRQPQPPEALIDEFRPDLLHAHKLYNQLSVAPVVVASGSGHPDRADVARLRVHQREPIRPPGSLAGPGRRALSYRMLNSAVFMARRNLHRPRVSAWISVSKYVAERHAAHGIVSTALPNFVSGIDGQPAPDFEQRTGAVFIGRLNSRKGVQDVLALAEAEPELPITIAGAGRVGGRVQKLRLHAPQPQLRRLCRAGARD